jgi:N6-L-threonylcarbamoyladenine synthase
MKILAIETSCDETSLALIEKCTPLLTSPNLGEEESQYVVHSHETISQMNLHREWGGVYPTLSRREHEKNLIPLLHKVLKDADLLEEKKEKENLESFGSEIYRKLRNDIELLERYPELKENTFDFFSKYKLKEKIAKENFCIAVTNGPGLPPALWVGVNFAKVISILLSEKNKPISLYPINHMEGHIVGAISKTTTPSVSNETATPSKEGEPQKHIIEISKIKYPVVNLLISGGHTELVLSDKNLSYKKIGETQDDAVGECFDKVARMLDLPYPGGPEISKLANVGRSQNVKSEFKFPRPMMHSNDLHFSFSGLKTHILYLLQKLGHTSSQPSPNLGEGVEQKNITLTEEIKIQIATEFEETVKDIFIHKTKKAILEYSANTLVVGGGVASNTYLKENLLKPGNELNIETFISDKTLSTDNALMIALCAANQIENNIPPTEINNFSAIGSKHYDVW